MGVTIPQPFHAKVDGPIGPVTVDGIPDTFHIDIEHLPKIQLGVDPLTINPLTIEPLTINPVTLSLTPVELDLRVTELPNTRAHLPANFTVGLSVLGFDLFRVRLCGEAQVITEPYRPDPCEHCGEVTGGLPVPAPT